MTSPNRSSNCSWWYSWSALDPLQHVAGFWLTIDWRLIVVAVLARSGSPFVGLDIFYRIRPISRRGDHNRCIRHLRS